MTYYYLSASIAKCKMIPGTRSLKYTRSLCQCSHRDLVWSCCFLSTYGHVGKEDSDCLCVRPHAALFSLFSASKHHLAVWITNAIPTCSQVQLRAVPPWNAGASGTRLEC